MAKKREAPIIKLKCPYCGKEFYRPADIGEPIRCPACHQLFRIKTKGALHAKLHYAIRETYNELRNQGIPLQQRLEQIAELYSQDITVNRLSYVLGCADSPVAVSYLRTGYARASE